MLNFHRDLQWRNMRNQAFFEPNLCKVLKPIIWVDTKFEQNGKMENSIERWQKLQAEVHISYMINTWSPNLTKSYVSLVIMQKIQVRFSIDSSGIPRFQQKCDFLLQMQAISLNAKMCRNSRNLSATQRRTFLVKNDHDVVSNKKKLKAKLWRPKIESYDLNRTILISWPNS